jgi:hypothetical protein
VSQLLACARVTTMRVGAHGVLVSSTTSMCRYNCGKVCLSLLGTWQGDKGEGWLPGISTANQVSRDGAEDCSIQSPAFCLLMLSTCCKGVGSLRAHHLRCTSGLHQHRPQLCQSCSAFGDLGSLCCSPF